MNQNKIYGGVVKPNSEHIEQALLFQWAAFVSNKYPMLNLMFAIPNGGKRYAKTAIDLKHEGVKPGVADVFLPYASGNAHGLFVEMKREKYGIVSDKQKNFIKNVQQQGYAAAVCYGFEQAKDTIIKYLNDDDVNTYFKEEL